MEFHPVTDKARIGGLRKLIQTDLAEAGWPENAAFDCLLAVSEACVNAILHGTDEGSSAPEIGWRITPTNAEFSVRNHSTRGWSRKAHPSNLKTEPPLVDRSGGWGLELMRLLMDDVVIDVGSDGTEVRLSKRLL